MSHPRYTLFVAMLVLLGAAAAVAADRPAKPPHVVFFLADDLGWSDVGFHGGEIRTPNIDRLAAGGARLEAFYVQPVCSPTRAALMTGRYPMRMGLQVGVIRPHAQYGLPLEERMLPQALRDAGYTTAICGKWHLGLHEPAYLPTHRGFDHQYGHYVGALDYFTHERDGGFDWHRNDKVCRDEGYTTVLLGDEAVRIVEQHDPARPLFLYVPFNAPHTPLQALDEHLKLYDHIADPKRRKYAAMVHCVDEQIGRIVAATEKRGMTEDTLFIFSSDNGGPIQLGATNGKLRAGKGTLYEGGVRVTALANWPAQIQPGTVVNAPLHIVDWYPTLLNLARASSDQPLPVDGRDIWPVLTAGAESPHDEILLNAAPAGGAIRAGNWKLVLRGDRSAVDEASARPNNNRRPAAREGVELFDLSRDLEEKQNLAAEHPQQVERLLARLANYQQQAVPPRNEPLADNFKVPAVWGE
jgi:arylsulfatase A-like enzyme